MRQHFKKVFANKENLYSMINLRRNGWGVTSLAVIFGCDWTSVRDQCQKYGILPLNGVYTIERIESKVLPTITAFQEMLKAEIKKEVAERKILVTPSGERINMGKSYKEYFEKRYHIPIENKNQYIYI